MESNIRHLSIGGYVGFDTLPTKYVSKKIKDGFIFNIMCVGESGIGKKTLMNSLFKTIFEEDQDVYYTNQTTLKSNCFEIQEGDVRIKLTLCHTVSFGDDMHKRNSVNTIASYVDDQFQHYFQQEFSRKQCDLEDRRIHVCLYFICPTGNSLKVLDLRCMKTIGSKVNVIPIIGKADTISKTQMCKFKEKILQELSRNNVQIYFCPLDEPEVVEINQQFNSLIPFAVVGSTDFVDVEGNMTRARKYPWGIVEIENENHCDFAKLREMLIRVNLEDLRERTHFIHYERYRKQELENMGLTDVSSSNKPITFQQMLEESRKKFSIKKEECKTKFELSFKIVEDELEIEERKINEKMRLREMELVEKRKSIEILRRTLNDQLVEFKNFAGKRKSLSSSSSSIFSLGKRC